MTLTHHDTRSFAQAIPSGNQHGFNKETTRNNIGSTTPLRATLHLLQRPRAVFTRAACENACGKLPTRRLSATSYSSDSSPTSFLNLKGFSKSRFASLNFPSATLHL